MNHNDNKPTPHYTAGTLTKKQVREYLLNLKLFLATQGVSPEEKNAIENEIAEWQYIRKISERITAF